MSVPRKPLDEAAAQSILAFLRDVLYLALASGRGVSSVVRGQFDESVVEGHMRRKATGGRRIEIIVDPWRNEPATSEPSNSALTPDEQAHVDSQRARCSSDTQGLLAIIDRLTGREV